MRVAFRKMHGLGNDFMVIDARSRPVELDGSQVRALADRRTGVGFDQLMLLEPARNEGVHASYRIFNADGSEVGQCGNGVRCLARLLAEDSARTDQEIVLQGPGKRVTAKPQGGGVIAVNMGEPDFEPQSVPFEAERPADRYALEIEGDILEIGIVSMGNPHAVLACADVADAPVATLGAKIAVHPRFPRQTNVEFMQVSDAQHIRLRVFERGVGETRACGSGACGAVAVGRRWGVLEDTVEVSLPGGALQVDWRGPGHSLWLTGPTVDVFGGHIDL